MSVRCRVGALFLVFSVGQRSSRITKECSFTRMSVTIPDNPYIGDVSRQSKRSTSALISVWIRYRSPVQPTGISLRLPPTSPNPTPILISTHACSTLLPSAATRYTAADTTHPPRRPLDHPYCTTPICGGRRTPITNYVAAPVVPGH